MENCFLKRKGAFLKQKASFYNYSSRSRSGKDDELTSRSKFEGSDSEFFESGIVSRAQSPSIPQISEPSEIESILDLSSVIESDDFLEITLGSELMMTDKILTCSSSMIQEAESTMVPGHHKCKLSNFMPEIECVETTLYCHYCKTYVQSKLEIISDTLQGKFCKIFLEVFSFCNMPKWAARNTVHICSICLNVLAKVRVSE